MSKKSVDFPELSSEEQQAIQILANATHGTTKHFYDIARTLGISPTEASKLIVNLKKKMGVDTNEELVELAEEKGLLTDLDQIAPKLDKSEVVSPQSANETKSPTSRMRAFRPGLNTGVVVGVLFQFLTMTAGPPEIPAGLSYFLLIIMFIIGPFVSWILLPIGIHPTSNKLLTFLGYVVGFVLGAVVTAGVLLIFI